MKALSIMQPWAWLICAGHKDIENRSWSTGFRGPVLIHAGKKFDVPTLREVWRTSPYMHDGRAVTIYEVIKTHNPQDKRGNTSTLTDDQIRDLAEYVESL